LLGLFDTLPYEEVVRRRAKRLSKRSRKMADRQATLMGEGRKLDGSIEVSGQQLRRATLLPRRQTATMS
jgi:hypothetical protein